jgi:ribose transport system ATP-binding protein
VNRLSVLDNLMLGSRLDHGVLVRRRKEAGAATAALAVLECGVPLDRLVADCTPVERTFVALSKSLCATGSLPRLLILDEPTATLSASGVERLFGVLRDLAGNGVTIVFIGHRLHEIEEIADTVSVLRDGRIVADFAASAVNPDAVLDAMIGSKDLPAGPAAAAADIPVRAAPSVLSPQQARLPVLELFGLAVGGSGISARVEAGSIIGFAGAEGSGREKLGSVLAGLAKPLAGTAVVGGSVITSARRAKAAGLVVVPNYRLPGAGVAQFSIQENLSLAARAGQLLTHDGGEGAMAREWVRRLEITPADPKAQYGLLSGGNKQKVMIARGILAEPRVLVLDEPTAGVDPAARDIIYATVRSLADSSVIIVVISNDFLDLQICDRVIVFSSTGRPVEVDFASAGLDSLQEREREILHAML